MRAVDVIAAVIGYIQGLIFIELEKGDGEKAYNNENIHWVFTIPATWDQKAKQCMHDAAQNVILSLFFFQKYSYCTIKLIIV